MVSIYILQHCGTELHIKNINHYFISLKTLS